MSPPLVFVDPPTLAARLEKGHNAGPGQWMARCPCHADVNPSLSIKRGRNGATLVHCFAGCAPKALLAHFRSMGFTLKPLPPGAEKRKRAVTIAESMALRACTPTERTMFWLIREGRRPTYDGFEAGGVRRTAIPGGLRVLEALGLIVVARAAYRADRQRYDRNQYASSDQWRRWEPSGRATAAKTEAFARAKAAAAAARKAKGDEGKAEADSPDLRLPEVTPSGDVSLLRGDDVTPLRGDFEG